jgi:hypothetical protein
MRTQFGSHVTVLGRDPENERFLYCRRDDGSELWAEISQLRAQDDADLDMLAKPEVLASAPEYAL